MKFITKCPSQTKMLAKIIANSFKGGEVILANGDLGAGKTAFAQGIGLGLGVKQIINSPTFNIMKFYKGKKLNFYHIDAYRLEDTNEVSDIGLDEEIGNPDGVCLIEWSNFIKQYLPEHYLEVNITKIGKNSRLIEIEEK